jgi:hypothetical protein
MAVFKLLDINGDVAKGLRSPRAVLASSPEVLIPASLEYAAKMSFFNQRDRSVMRLGDVGCTTRSRRARTQATGSSADMGVGRREPGIGLLAGQLQSQTKASAVGGIFGLDSHEASSLNGLGCPA